MVDQTLRPNGAGHYQQWETLVDASHWGATSDQNDATYIQTQVQARIDVEALQDPTFGDSDTVNSVTIYCRAYALGGGGPERIDFRERLGSTDRDQGNNLPVTRNSWNQYNGATQTTAPDGGPWTKQKVTDLQVGVEARTLRAGETLRISEIWVVVDYTAGVTETIVAQEFPMLYLAEPVTANELTSRVSGATVTIETQDFPRRLLKKGKASELRSKWS